LERVDAVLVEDADGELGREGLQRVCAQVPSLLKPGGVCVVVLGGGDAAGGTATLFEEVAGWLQASGLAQHADTVLEHPAPAAAGAPASLALQSARAGVWLQAGE
jgi:hypothetical protein